MWSAYIIPYLDFQLFINRCTVDGMCKYILWPLIDTKHPRNNILSISVYEICTVEMYIFNTYGNNNNINLALYQTIQINILLNYDHSIFLPSSWCIFTV